MSVKLNSGFEIAKFSDLRYEKMAVELRHDGVPIAEINKDKGDENMEIEFPSRFSPENYQFLFNLSDLLEAIRAAQDFLRNL
jgi:hypothetical protein